MLRCIFDSGVLSGCYGRKKKETKLKDRLGRSKTWAYDDGLRTTTIETVSTKPGPAEVSREHVVLTHDRLGRPKSRAETKPDGVLTTQWTYTAAGDLDTQKVLADATVISCTQFAYDRQHNLLSRVRHFKDCNGEVAQTASHTIDADGTIRETVTTGPTGVQWTEIFDVLGRLTKRTLTAAGNAAVAPDLEGAEWTWTWTAPADGSGWQVLERGPIANSDAVLKMFDGQGRLKEVKVVTSAGPGGAPLAPECRTHFENLHGIRGAQLSPSPRLRASVLASYGP